MTSERLDLTPIALGFCITAAGILLLLHNVGMLDAAEAIRYWPLALVLVGGAMMWSSMHGGRTTISLGAIFWIVVLGSLFNYTFARRQIAAESIGSDQVNVFAVLGEDRRPPITGHFGGAKLTAVWGGAQLDLRQALLPPGEEAVIDVFTVMGGSTIRVPTNWKVDVEASAIAGGINNRTTSGRDADRDKSDWDAPLPGGALDKGGAPVPAPRLIVRGAVLMGSVSIKP